MSSVEVNEAKVMSAEAGRDWWVDFRRFSAPGRVTVVRPTIIGDVVRVKCDSDGDAKQLAALMVDFAGMPKTAVRVVS